MTKNIVAVDTTTRYVTVANPLIGNKGENRVTKLIIKMTEFLKGNGFLEIRRPDPKDVTKCITQYAQMDMEEDGYSLPVLNSILQVPGEIELCLHIYSDSLFEGECACEIFKSSIFKMIVGETIDAEHDELEEYPDFFATIITKTDKAIATAEEVKKMAEEGKFDGRGVVSFLKDEEHSIPGVTDVYRMLYTDDTYNTVPIHQGQDGVSPSAKVTTEGNVSTITITDKDGTTTAQIYAGSDYDDSEIKAEIKALQDEMPSKTSDLENDSGFIDKSVNDLTNYELKTSTGSSIDLSIDNQTYVMTLKLKNSAGDIISEGEADLPIESMIINVEYNDGILTFTLQNGQTIDVPISDLVDGLVPDTRTINGKDLKQDIVLTGKDIDKDYNTFTATEKTKLEGIETGAEVNVLEAVKINDEALDIEGKAVNILVDKVPTENSANLVESGGTFEALSENQEQIDNLEDLLSKANKSGTTIDIDNAKAYKMMGEVVDGKYQQDATPSPENPQEITQVSSVTLNRCGKNMANPRGVSWTNNGITIEKLSEGRYRLNGTSTAAFDYAIFGNRKIYLTKDKYYRLSRIAWSGTTTGTGPSNCRLITPTTSTWAWLRSDNASAKKAPENSYIDLIVLAIGNNITFTNYVFSVQLEEVENADSPATSYEVYNGQFTNIDLDGNEVCAVSDTIKDQLMIDKNGNVILKKNVAKLVLDGSENWRYVESQSQSDTAYFERIISDAKYYASTGNCVKYSNLFIAREVWGGNLEGIYLQGNNKMLMLRIDKDRLADVSIDSFKTWLSTHNVITYYELNTPQIIELPKLTTLPTTLSGINHIWTETNIGLTNIEIIYVEDIERELALSIEGKEDISNKVTTISSSSTDTQYPSAKCVYDIVGDIESALEAI